MKKIMSLVLAFAMMSQVAFASDTASIVRETADQLVAAQLSSEAAAEYLQAHISAAEYARIAQAMQDSYFAGTLKQDIDGIVASVQLQKSTGSSLHGANYTILRNVAIAVGVVVVVYWVLSNGVFMSAGTGLYGTDVGAGFVGF